MKIRQILVENNLKNEILENPANLKRFLIMWNHDTVNRNTLAKLGPRPTATEIIDTWISLVDKEINNAAFKGEFIKRNPFIKTWLLKQYLQGNVSVGDFYSYDFENPITVLNDWSILSEKQILKDSHRDLNKFKNTRVIKKILDNEYQLALHRAKEEIEFEYEKKNARYIRLIDDAEFSVSIPLTYGACRVFNYTGHSSSYCTGSSSGHGYFTQYTSKGPLITIIHKPTMNDEYGKFQLHLESDSLESSNSRKIGFQKFEEKFPGLLARILASMEQNAQEITKKIRAAAGNRRYYAQKTISRLRTQVNLLAKNKKKEQENLDIDLE